MKFMLLGTDFLIDTMTIGILVSVFFARKNELFHSAWVKVLNRPIAMFSFVIVMAFCLIGLLDSIHYYPMVQNQGKNIIFSTQIRSVLDALLFPLGNITESTYTEPFSWYFKKNISPTMLYLGIFLASLKAFLVWFFVIMVTLFISAKRSGEKMRKRWRSMISGKLEVAWRSIFLSLALVLWISFVSLYLSQFYHIFGTDKIGLDIFYETLKSVRTALVIGTVTTLFMLPLSIFFGTVAGYFGGWIDDVIQYIYTTLSSVPGILLITASVLSFQVFMANHPSWFPNSAIWGDARLLILCAILGITSWTELCRLLRGETLKLREIDFVKAALVMGSPSYKIILRHILPNTFHIILITSVLNFSSLVLIEAVLSYVGVGVDSTTMSWGNMINSARLELARDPVVWWPLSAAFIFMLALVLSANLFADAVRDAFDPKYNKIRNSHDRT